MANSRLEIMSFSSVQQGTFQANLESLLGAIQDVFEDLPLLQDLHFFLERAKRDQSQAGTQRFPQPLQEGLEVRNLRFRYPEATEDVLQDINFSCASLGRSSASSGSTVRGSQPS